MAGKDVTHLVDCSQLGSSEVSAADEELQLAASVGVPVLISGSPAASREIACELDRRSSSPAGSVEVVDCRRQGAIAALRSTTGRGTKRCDAGRAKILLFQEVHALSPGDQALLARQLERQRVRSNPVVRILASSSVPLFDRVVDQLFNESLFYRLNVIHIVIPLDRNPPEPYSPSDLPL
jgi:transcriptional regulator of acetoin/glycerol metabolism